MYFESFVVVVYKYCCTQTMIQMFVSCDEHDCVILGNDVK